MPDRLALFGFQGTWLVTDFSNNIMLDYRKPVETSVPGVRLVEFPLAPTLHERWFETRRYRTSHAAGSFADSAPYVCETTKPLACDM